MLQVICDYHCIRSVQTKLLNGSKNVYTEFECFSSKCVAIVIIVMLAPLSIKMVLLMFNSSFLCVKDHLLVIMGKNPFDLCILPPAN